MLTKIDQLTQAVQDAGIPITGLSGTGERCRLQEGDKHLTEEQRAQAEAIIKAFDWEVRPVLPAAELQARFKEAPPELRQKFWDLVLGEVALQWCVDHPDQAAEFALETTGQPVDLRKPKEG